MTYDECRPFQGAIRCYECGSVLEVIEGEKVEPCWNCIKQATQDGRNSLLGKSSAQKEAEEKLERKLEEVRKEYQAND